MEKFTVKTDYNFVHSELLYAQLTHTVFTILELPRCPAVINSSALVNVNSNRNPSLHTHITLGHFH